LTDTRRRILEAAGEVFAESGFRHTTIRQICARAAVNIAAVNYHFGDKESLYIAVLRFWRSAAFEKYPLDLQIDESKSPEEHIRLFIYATVFRILDEGQSSWFGKLVAREYIEPTPALDMLIEETMGPTFVWLSSLVRLMLGEDMDDEAVRLCCASIVSQCLFFIFARSVIKRLFQHERFQAEEIQRIADHITRFSLHAIRALAKDRKGR